MNQYHCDFSYELYVEEMAEEVEEDPSILPKIEDSASTEWSGNERRTSIASGPTHEGYVRPASYLRWPQSRPMQPAQPETAIDSEQRRGLVGSIDLYSLPSWANW